MVCDVWPLPLPRSTHPAAAADKRKLKGMSQRKPRLSISKLKFKSQKQKGAKSKRELVVGEIQEK